jgi:hypothetical protein
VQDAFSDYVDIKDAALMGGWCKHGQHWIQGNRVRQDVRSD